MSVRRVMIEADGKQLSFYHTQVSTGFGEVPLAISEKTLRDKDIKEGSLLMVDGCIAAKVLEVYGGGLHGI